MATFGIDGSTKEKREVYTKEEINIMLNGKIGTIGKVGQFDEIAAQSHAEVVIKLNDIDGVPLGVIGFQITGAGFEHVIVDTFSVEYTTSGYCVRLGVYNADTDPYAHLPFNYTVLYMKQYE